MKVGDTVVLKSGESPRMTVTKIVAHEEGRTTIDVMWFGPTPAERPASLYGVEAKAFRKAKDED